MLSTSSLTAIDIGSCETKLTTGQWRGQSLAIGECFVVPTPGGTLNDGYLAQTAQFGAYLRGVLRDNRITKGQVAFSIDSTQVIMREIVLPSAPDTQLGTMVSYEVAKHFPIRIQDYVTSFHRIEDFVEEGVKKSRLLVAALPKEMEEGYWSLATAIGLRPMCLEMQAASIARILATEPALMGVEAAGLGNWAVIDIGHTKLNISFVSDGKLALTRTIAAGGAALDEALALSFDISVIRAREIKHHASLVPPEDGEETAEMAQARQVVNVGVDDWIREIQPVFRYYLGQDENHRIDGILLHGGSSRLGGIAGRMQEAFNRPAHLMDVNAKTSIQLHPSALNQCFLIGIGALMQAKKGG